MNAKSLDPYAEPDLLWEKESALRRLITQAQARGVTVGNGRVALHISRSAGTIRLADSVVQQGVRHYYVIDGLDPIPLADYPRLRTCRVAGWIAVAQSAKEESR
ncbi:MAG: hypothetical protein HY420_02420 [Candidatus Kerfeldbacteria bacterium]|nr:hypothetical protein [Candidatus Kerfeldbacteria bacterium]